MISNMENCHFLTKLLRFLTTGVFVTAIHITIATLLIEYVELPPICANGIAFVIATIISYLINTVWSFSTQLRGKILLRFIIVSIICLLWTILMSWIAQQLEFHYLFGILIIAVTIPPLSFILHNYWTYREASFEDHY
ncbi:GtrA family protein [Serratia microhaemolytica]|uniref:GtrA family protein n=1 Tax=Serratia microhaemolytica TaxID=2675110 RepID=UPI003B830127